MSRPFLPCRLAFAEKGLIPIWKMSLAADVLGIELKDDASFNRVGTNGDGVSVERMATSPLGRELMAGFTSDDVFAPAITFGSGGIASVVFGIVLLIAEMFAPGFFFILLRTTRAAAPSHAAEPCAETTLQRPL